MAGPSRDADGGRAGRQPQGHSRLTALVTEGGARWRAGDGARGPHWDAWRGLPRAGPWPPAWRRGLWRRRRLRDPTAQTASVGLAPHETTRAAVVQGAGSRWTMERCLCRGKG